jgi:hypothetical protein
VEREVAGDVWNETRHNLLLKRVDKVYQQNTYSQSAVLVERFHRVPLLTKRMPGSETCRSILE